MNNKNILIIGGTGYLGSSLVKNKPSMYNIYVLNSIQVNTNNFQSVQQIMQYINIYKIDIIIDFARNTKRQLNTFLLLINKLPMSCKYVNISTYGIMFDKVYVNEAEYNYVKLKIEQKTRQIDLSIRVPLIIDNINEIEDKMKNVKTNFVYINYSINFAKYIFKLLDNNVCGINIMPSVRYEYK